VDFRRLTFVTALAVSCGCAATTTPPPAPSDDLLFQMPADRVQSMDDAVPGGQVQKPRADTPECRALFLDLRRTLSETVYCDRDEECTVTFGAASCEPARVDSQPMIQQKGEALRRCRSTSEPQREPPSCSSLRAFCMRNSCRILKPEKGD
jgi:hypothetical protein